MVDRASVGNMPRRSLWRTSREPGEGRELFTLKVLQLNPVEGVWSHLKGGVLANRGDDTVEELIELATGGVHKARSQQLLLFGFLGQTGLTL